MIRNFVPCFLLTLAASGFAYAQGDARQFVRSAYLQLLDREPEPEALFAGARNIREGRITPDNYKAGLLASAEFFNRNGADGRAWVIALYRKVLNRNPSEQEIAGWMQRLVVYQGNREPVAQEFMTSPEANGPIGPRPPQPGGNLPESLVNSAQHLVNAITAEVPVSMSYLLRAQANAFLQATRNAAPFLSNPVGNPVAFQNAVANLQNSLNNVRNTFAGIPGAAVTTRRRLAQCEEILAAIAASAPGPIVPPVWPQPLPPGFDNPGYEFYSRQLAELTRSTSQLVFQLRTVMGRSITLPQLLSEAEALSAQADNLKTGLRNGTSFPQFQAEVAAMRRRVRTINAQMDPQMTPPNVTQSWFETVRVVDEIARRAGLGSGNGGYVNPDFVVPGGPTFDQLPVQVVPNNIVQARARAIANIDSCIAQVDGIIIANNAMLFQYPNLARFLQQMRAFRASLAAFRVETASGAGPVVLQQRLAQLNADLQAASAYYQGLGLVSMQQSVQGMRNLFDLLTQLNRLFYNGN